MESCIHAIIVLFPIFLLTYRLSVYIICEHTFYFFQDSCRVPAPKRGVCLSRISLHPAKIQRVSWNATPSATRRDFQLPVIRATKDKDFTVMSIHHLRDTQLSLKAMGYFPSFSVSHRSGSSPLPDWLPLQRMESPPFEGRWMNWNKTAIWPGSGFVLKKGGWRTASIPSLNCRKRVHRIRKNRSRKSLIWKPLRWKILYWDCSGNII